MSVSYDQFLVGVGFFAGYVCEHEWCQHDPEPAVVYLEQLDAHGNGGHYLCGKHFNHLVATVASENAEAAAARGRLRP